MCKVALIESRGDALHNTELVVSVDLEFVVYIRIIVAKSQSSILVYFVDLIVSLICKPSFVRSEV